MRFTIHLVHWAHKLARRKNHPNHPLHGGLSVFFRLQTRLLRLIGKGTRDGLFASPPSRASLGRAVRPSSRSRSLLAGPRGPAARVGTSDRRSVGSKSARVAGEDEDVV